MSVSSYNLTGKRVWVAGHRGMVGSAVVRKLQQVDHIGEIITVTHSDLDLTRQADVEKFMANEKPDVLIICAAVVGGILANDSYPVEFLYQNMMIQNNLIKAAAQNDVEKLVLLGSSCIYPKHADQPISEDSLLTGPLEPTNEWYALAKIAGVKLCAAYRRQYGKDFISLMPTNLYGPGDNYSLETSHVIPALLRKAHFAKASRASFMEVWGTGKVRREFMHVDDLADAIVFLTMNYSAESHINIGVGKDIKIAELAQLIGNVVGFEGEIRFDTTKPDGSPRKLLNSANLNRMGWEPKISLKEGLQSTYSDAMSSFEKI